MKTFVTLMDYDAKLHTEDKHISKADPKALLNHFKDIKYNGESNREVVEELKVKISDNSDTQVVHLAEGWLRYAEYTKLREIFRRIYLEQITNIQIGYVYGLVSPFVVEDRESYYEVYIKFIR